MTRLDRSVQPTSTPNPRLRRCRCCQRAKESELIWTSKATLPLKSPTEEKTLQLNLKLKSHNVKKRGQFGGTSNQLKYAFIVFLLFERVQNFFDLLLYFMLRFSCKKKSIVHKSWLNVRETFVWFKVSLNIFPVRTE